MDGSEPSQGIRYLSYLCKDTERRIPSPEKHDSEEKERHDRGEEVVADRIGNRESLLDKAKKTR
jgi:hypothetical protein